MRNLCKSIFLCIVLILLFQSPVLISQNITVPNYNNLCAEVNNENSSVYFPTLIQKYFSPAVDALSDYEKHCLYYGFTCQSWYSPNSNSKDEKELIYLLKKKKNVRQDYKDIIYYADMIIKTNPFSTLALQWKTVALFKTGQSNTPEYDKTVAQYSAIMEAIIHSGKGTEMLPYYVTSVDNEYETVKYLDYIPVRQETIFVGSEKQLDKIILAPNRDSTEFLIFDISPVLEKK